MRLLCEAAFYHLAHLTNKPKQMSKHYHLTNKLIIIIIIIRIIIKIRVIIKIIIRLLMLIG